MVNKILYFILIDIISFQNSLDKSVDFKEISRKNKYEIPEEFKQFEKPSVFIFNARCL